MKMLNVITILAAAILITGCLPDRLSPTGNAAKFYQPYNGEQGNWPINSQGSFTSTYGGMTIYHGPPNVPYTVLGRFDRSNIPIFRLVKCARHYRADAIFMSEQIITAYETQHGVTFGNQNVAITTPSTIKPVSATERTAYLIKIRH